MFVKKCPYCAYGANVDVLGMHSVLIPDNGVHLVCIQPLIDEIGELRCLVDALSAQFREARGE